MATSRDGSSPSPLPASDAEVIQAFAVVGATIGRVLLATFREQPMAPERKEPDGPQTYTRKAAAKYLGFSATTLDRYKKKGLIKPSAVVGSSQRFTTRDLDQLLKKLRAKKGEL